MTDKQTTIKKPISFSGKGLHTGLHVTLTINPAPANHGYVFQRIDLEGKPKARALAENVVDTSRSTVIEENGARIGTIEHVLSALAGLQVDNALIEVDAPETPILDGSAKLYVEKIQEVGVDELDAEREYFVIKEKIIYREEESDIEIVVMPDSDFSINVMIDYQSHVLGNQYATLKSIKDYKTEIAECRTFVFFKEIEPLLKNNLIKGGDIENAIILVEKKVTQEEIDRLADICNQPRLKVKEQGILNNITLKFFNEPARHKVLDLIGDLALTGIPFKGKVFATKPGHRANTMFAKLIRKEIKKYRSKPQAPVYDLSAEPLIDINGIKKLLPHRPPFLMVDKILDIKAPNEIIGVKNVTMNEPFFVGHFPEEPVMPGVLIIEAMAQISGILVLNTYEKPEEYSTYFLRIDAIKFRKKVVPGDTVVFRCIMTTPIRRGIANMSATAFVGENVVAEGEFMAQITKTKVE